MRRTLFNVRFLGLAFLALLAGVWPMAAQAGGAPGLGSASTFAVLSAAPGGTGAVTCTGGTITGNVGSSGPMASVVQTGCTITGTIIAPVSAQVLADFNTGYNALGSASCGQTLTGTLAGVTLGPGVYCFSAAATLTGTLTLAGPANGMWTFKIGSGTPATGALTGTSFSVVMAGGGLPCNVNWWVAQAATMTDSQFVGTILAGAAITLTRGTFSGNALAKAGVTITGTNLTGCAATSGKGHGKEKEHCNQGVGNGPEGCDPGNSDNKHTSNDELGGTPGDPGRKGGNGDGGAAAKVDSSHNSSGDVAAKVDSNVSSNGTVAAKGNSSHNSKTTGAAKGNSGLKDSGKSHAKSKSK